MGPVLAVAAIAVVCALGAWWLHAQLRGALARDRALRAWARREGLDVAASDHVGVTRLQLGVLAEGDGRRVELLLFGDRAGGAVRLFDLTTWTEHRDRSGKVRRIERGYSCALVEVPAMLPPLRIEPEGLFAKVANALGADDLRFESDEFNRAFRVTSPDPRFASAFLDARLMEWLLSRRIPCTIDVGGWWVLFATERVDAAAMVGLLGAACDFRSRIPPVVAELYPRAGEHGWAR